MSTGGVVVTGGNGFLGCHLLAALQHRGISPLRTLVRADNLASAHTRLQQANRIHGLDLDLQGITLIPWDLMQPELGLRPEERNALFSGISTVLHAAAAVNFLSRPEQLQLINTSGTKQLLGWAVKAGVQRWLQMSSLAVFNGFTWPVDIAIPEEPILGKPTQPLGGYASSKLCAERICLETRPTATDISVLRIPYLHASFKSFSANPNGYLDVMLRAVLELGSIFEQDFSYHGLPVDKCAEWVVELAMASSSGKSVVHVIADSTLHWHEWSDAIRENGDTLQTLPMRLWFEKLREQAPINKSKSLLAAYAFLSLDKSRERWMHANAHRLKFERDNLLAVLPEASQKLELPSNYMQTVLKNLAAHHKIISTLN